MASDKLAQLGLSQACDDGDELARNDDPPPLPQRQDFRSLSHISIRPHTLGDTAHFRPRCCAKPNVPLRSRAPLFFSCSWFPCLGTPKVPAPAPKAREGRLEDIAASSTSTSASSYSRTRWTRATTRSQQEPRLSRFHFAFDSPRPNSNTDRVVTAKTCSACPEDPFSALDDKRCYVIIARFFEERYRRPPPVPLEPSRATGSHRPLHFHDPIAYTSTHSNRPAPSPLLAFRAAHAHHVNARPLPSPTRDVTLTFSHPDPLFATNTFTTPQPRQKSNQVYSTLKSTHERTQNARH